MPVLFVSLIVPCRNEAQYIEACLRSIATNDYPHGSMEILVIDGLSTDNTRHIIQRLAQEFTYLKLIENPKKIIPVAMNIGIRAARGEVIMKMDAHSTYPLDYISKCVRALQKYNADNVGGVVHTLPGANTVVARTIAKCLVHPMGVGNSPFRRKPASKEPREVDTVAFGCYKKAVFQRIGLYNENLVRSSDMELNLRLKRAGGKIILVPDIVVDYYADPTLLRFLRHNFSDGVWATYPVRYTKRLLRPRHLAPVLLLLSFFLFPPLVLGYLGLLLVVSFPVAISSGDPRYFFLMPLTFVIRHLAYGLGSLIGIIKIVSKGNENQ